LLGDVGFRLIVFYCVVFNHGLQLSAEPAQLKIYIRVEKRVLVVALMFNIK